MGKLSALRPFWAEELLRSLFSPLCVFCHRRKAENGGTCLVCWKEKTALQKPQEKDGILTLFSYEGEFQELLLDFKKNRNYCLYLPLSRWIKQVLPEDNHATLLLAPPSHKRMTREGVDPLLLIGRALAGQEFKVISPFYKKGSSQKMLGRQERLEQIKVSLFLKSGQDLSPLKGKSVILLDDLVTTGATLGELEIRLKAVGVSSLQKIAIARAPSKDPSPLND